MVTSSLGGDGRSAIYFSSTKDWLLGTALDRARSGFLKPDWRDHLAPLHEPGTKEQHLADAEAAAVTEVQCLPAAAWEPGQSVGWRIALRAWYTASRLLVVEKYARSAEITGQQVLDFDERQVTDYFAPAEQTIDQALKPFATFDEITDQQRIKTLWLHIVERDTLTASYLAGLAAGGDDIDWLSWYADRVNQWPPPYAESGRAQVENTGFRHFTEQLPDYWRSPTIGTS